MVTEAEIKKSRDDGRRYVIAEKRVSTYAPPPKYSAGQAGMVGFFVSCMALIVFTGVAGLDLSSFTYSSIFTVGLFTLLPAAYSFHLQSKYNEAIRREMAALERAGE